jgi:phospholipid/cholesterol/gamma-HCH transport system permease protein
MIRSIILEDIVRLVRKLGRTVIDQIWGLGAGARLFLLVLVSSGESFRRFRLVIREVYFTGVKSLVIISVSAFFVGMVLGLQGYNTLEKYGSSEAIGVLVALSLVRELGPVVTALLFAGRAGTAITAEIGLMKTTEQLSAMEMMAVSPISRVIAPKFWAGVIALPILAVLFSMIGILGGYMVAVPLIGVDSGAFWSQMQANVDWRYDIVDGVIKSVVFGVACTMIALFQGYDAAPTAEGVSGATTRTVVTSSLAVLALDFALTSFMIK